MRPDRVQPGFQWYYGDPAQGPAYWSDQGVLCSSGCALKHFQSRQASGEDPSGPAAPPFDE